MVRALGIDFERRRLCGLSFLVSLVNFNIYVNGYSGSYPPANDLHWLQILHNGENDSLTVAFGVALPKEETKTRCNGIR